MRLTAFFHPLARIATVTMLAALTLAGCGSTTPARPDAGTQPALSSSAPPVRIGIALGGGAAKGFAHIGVIKMLEANGFAPAVVSGTSAGSVVGALYASGMNAFEMQEKAVALDEAKIRDLQLSSGGLVLGQKLEDYVNEQVRRKPLEQMAKPFVVVATRLEDGERTVFARGNTGQAVRASSSVPGVFQPVTIGKYHFVDGGIVSPVPVDAARQLGADMVIAVDISNKARGIRRATCWARWASRSPSWVRSSAKPNWHGPTSSSGPRCWTLDRPISANAPTPSWKAKKPPWL